MALTPYTAQFKALFAFCIVLKSWQNKTKTADFLLTFFLSTSERRVGGDSTGLPVGLLQHFLSQ